MNDQVSPPPPPPPPPPPAGDSPHFKPGFNLELDARSMETLKWSAVWNTVATGINILAGYVAGFFLGGSVGSAIKELFWAAIYGAVIGVFISKFYPHIKQWNVKYLKGRLNTFFKLLFYPAVTVNVLVFFMTSFVTFATGIVFHVIVFAGFIFGSYIYAKMMDRKVSHLFEPPV